MWTENKQIYDLKGVVYDSGESLLIFEQPNKHTSPFSAPSNSRE